jgi:hypothetical protein
MLATLEFNKVFHLSLFILTCKLPNCIGFYTKINKLAIDESFYLLKIGKNSLLSSSALGGNGHLTPDIPHD